MNNFERFEMVRKMKIDWRFCPRCNAKAINKDKRICTACKGVVLFPGDDAGYANERRDYWYRWHKSINNVFGWFPRSYWNHKE